MEFNRLWYIRANHDPFDPREGYVNKPNLFTAEIHYGGVFKKSPGRKYIRGRVKHVDDVDIDKFSVHEFHLMVKLFEFYPEKIPLYYHFQIPGKDLDIGLEAFGNDQDVLSLSKYIPDHKIIKFYIEHEKTNVDTYLKSPGMKSSVIIEELPNEHENATPPVKRKLFSPLEKTGVIIDELPARSKKLVPRRRMLLEYDGSSKIAESNVPRSKSIEVNLDVPVEGNLDVPKSVEVEVNPTREGSRLDDYGGFEDLDFSQLFPKETEDNQAVDKEVNKEGEGDNEVHNMRHNEWCGDEWSGHHHMHEDGENEDGSSDEEDSSSEDDDSQDSDFRLGKDDELEDVDVDMTDYVDEMEEYVGKKLQLCSDEEDEDSEDHGLDLMECDSYADGSTNRDSETISYIAYMITINPRSATRITIS